MSERDNKYDVEIVRGKSPLNDEIIDFIKPKIVGKYLDIGCNSGWLLSEVPRGTGVDLSKEMVNKAIDKHLIAMLVDGTDRLPFPYKSFDTVVMSCVLEQNSHWRKMLDEALRVVRVKVIGVSPYPDKSQWGRLSGTKWVKSVIKPDDLIKDYEAWIEPVNDTHYFFEIRNDDNIGLLYERN